MLRLCLCCLGNLSRNVRHSLSLLSCQSVRRTKSYRLPVIRHYLVEREKQHLKKAHHHIQGAKRLKTHLASLMELCNQMEERSFP